MPLYQIKDWDAHFENDRSRNRIQCSFVCVPNKQHGMGFCRIMAEPDGAAIYGIWHCIVGACSQQRKRNGWLTPDGDKAVSGWGVEDLALKFRRPEIEIARALEVLCSEKVGWIINHQNTPSHRAITAQSPPTHLEGRKEGIEGRKEVNGRFAPPTLESVKLQASKIGMPDVETEKFFNYYTSNGWRIGRNAMRSWPHALSNWKLNAKNYGHPKANEKANPRNNGVITDPQKQSVAVAEVIRRRSAARDLPSLGAPTMPD